MKQKFVQFDNELNILNVLFRLAQQNKAIDINKTHSISQLAGRIGCTDEDMEAALRFLNAKILEEFWR